MPKVQAPAGYTVKVTPSVLTVLPRQSATYTVEITRTTAASRCMVVRLAHLGGPARARVRSPLGRARGRGRGARRGATCAVRAVPSR